MRDPISIPMRCAVTGGRFHACFTWSPAREQYVLFSMMAVPGREAASPAPPPRGPASGPVARPPAAPAAVDSPGPIRGGLAPAVEFKPTEVDFTGFHCPHCGYGKTQPVRKHSFIKCGKCRELVCGARLVVEDGKDIFQCHASCGSRDALSGGTLESYSGQAHPGYEEPRSPSKVRVSVVPPTSLPRPGREEKATPQRPGLAPPRRPNLPAPARPGLPALNPATRRGEDR